MSIGYSTQNLDGVRLLPADARQPRILVELKPGLVPVSCRRQGNKKRSLPRDKGITALRLDSPEHEINLKRKP